MDFSHSDTEIMVAESCQELCKRLSASGANPEGYYRALDAADIWTIDPTTPDQMGLAQSAGRALGAAVAPTSLADELVKRGILRELEAAGEGAVDPDSVCLAHRVDGGTAIAEIWRGDPQHFLVGGFDSGWELLEASSVERVRGGAWEESLQLTSLIATEGSEPRTVPTGACWEAIHLAISDAEMLGAAQHMFNETVEYTKVRVQYDRPIGSFQAVQHRLASHFVALNAADVANAYGGYAVMNDPARHGRGVAWARASHAFAADAAFEVAKTCVQYHGGLSFTMDFWVHRWLRRIARLALRGGTVDEHYADVGHFLGAEERLDEYLSV